MGGLLLHEITQFNACFCVNAALFITDTSQILLAALSSVTLGQPYGDLRWMTNVFQK